MRVEVWSREPQWWGGVGEGVMQHTYDKSDVNTAMDSQTQQTCCLYFNNFVALSFQTVFYNNENNTNIVSTHLKLISEHPFCVIVIACPRRAHSRNSMLSFCFCTCQHTDLSTGSVHLPVTNKCHLLSLCPSY